jgi:hypothetical protein
MRNFRGSTGLPFIIPFLCVLTGTARGEQQIISRGEITQLLSGATLQMVAKNGESYEVVHYPEGTLSIKGTQTDYRDTGVWSVACREYCSRWDKSSGGAMDCYEIFALEDGNYRFVGEVTTYTVKILKVESSWQQKVSPREDCCYRSH